MAPQTKKKKAPPRRAGKKPAKRKPKRKPAAKRTKINGKPAKSKPGRRVVVASYAVEYDPRDPLAKPKVCPPRGDPNQWRDLTKRCVTMQLEWTKVTKDGRSKGWFGPYWYAYARKPSVRYKVPGKLISVYVGKPTLSGRGIVGPPGLPTVGDALYKLKERGAFDAD